jgi:hypothetical protein
MKTRILATLAITAALAVGVSAPAFASESYTGAVSANTVAPGGTVTYNSDNTGQPDGTDGTYSLSGGGQSSSLGGSTIQLASTVTHAVQVSAHSQLKFTFRMPSSAKPGSIYTLNVKAGKFADKQTIKIAGIAGAAAAGSVAPLWIVLALVLVLVLALVVVVITRRRAANKPA